MAETYSSIINGEETRRERAYQRERLSSEQDRLRRSIDHLQRQRAKQADLDNLQAIHALVMKVPGDLTARGSQFFAGGFILRDLLQELVISASAGIEVKLKATETAITKAQSDLAKVEQALKDF